VAWFLGVTSVTIKHPNIAKSKCYENDYCNFAFDASDPEFFSGL